MGMVVQHNMQASNANRMLGITTSAQAKSTEKLSSGYRINRAADDAAGLTISEKMRKQIRGLDKASSNAQDGVSAVQTAEGALTEVHSMLQRMNELATQASNGTNSDIDRDAIQAEMDQLTTEIDRVSETTKFNETYLLKGDADGATKTNTVAAHDAGLDGKLVDNGNGKTTFTLAKELQDGDKVKIGGKEYTVGTSGKGTVKDPSTLNTKTDGYAGVGTGVLDTATTTLATGDKFSVGGNEYTVTNKISLDELNLDTTNGAFQIGEYKYKVAANPANATNNGTSGKEWQVSAVDAKKLIKEALAAGKQVTATNFKGTDEAGTVASTATTTGTQVVLEYGKNEVSSVGLADQKVDTLAKKANGGTAPTFAAGDSITKAGVTTVATEGTPTAAKDAYKDINALAANDSVTIGSGKDAVKYTIVDDEADVDESSYKVTKDTILSKIKDGDTVNVNGAAQAITVIGDIGGTGTSGDVISAKTAYSLMADELQKASSIGTDEGKAATIKNEGNGKFTITQGSVEVKDSLSFSLHVGADADMTNKITVNVESMSAAGLGIKGIDVSDKSGASATYAIDAINDAISKVSSQRSALGAVQNRLEHTINNLDNVSENTQSAESRIRDTDIAKEMVEYSKNNILSQAGQSMLAQAKSSNQGVLSLLQ